MKLLKWHKLANESAIQAALLRTKNLKKIDQRKKIEEEHQEREERKIRFQIIIEEEKAKPIELEKDLKKSYSEKYSKMQSSRELSKERRLVQLEQMKTKMDERKIRRIKQGT